MRVSGIIIISMFLLSCGAEYKEDKHGTGEYEETQNGEIKWIRCYDGDTCTFIINGEKENVRFAGVDTPEIRGKCNEEIRMAKQARDFVIGILKNSQIRLENCFPGKYGRQVCEVYANGEKISDALISAGLGRPYTGGTRESWCN